MPNDFRRMLPLTLLIEVLPHARGSDQLDDESLQGLL